MEDKLYPIRNGPVTLYVDREYGGTKFEFKGLTVEGNKALYMSYVNEFNRIDVEDRPCVDLFRHLLGLYKAQADAELQSFVEQHINEPLNPLDFHGFYFDAGHIPIIEHTKTLFLERVVDGLVGLTINGTTCLYDLVAQKHIGCESHFRGPLTVTLLEVFYGYCLKPFLAYEQYKRGLAPAAYAELARLNDFIAGKKSVKLVMKDGAEHLYKPSRGNLSLRFLLDYAPSCAEPFTLCNPYDLHPRLNNGDALDLLDYLRFGKQQFRINAAALQSKGGLAPCNS